MGGLDSLQILGGLTRKSVAVFLREVDIAMHTMI